LERTAVMPAQRDVVSFTEKEVRRREYTRSF